MKRLMVVMLLLCLAGCYKENAVIIESDRPVEVHLRGMDQALKVAIPEIDGCDYFIVYSTTSKGEFFRANHYAKCHNCKKRSWPDGQKPMDTVEVRDKGTYQLCPLDIGGHEYFTIGSRYSYPDDIVHRGHCKKCAKERLIP